MLQQCHRTELTLRIDEPHLLSPRLPVPLISTILPSPSLISQSDTGILLCRSVFSHSNFFPASLRLSVLSRLAPSSWLGLPFYCFPCIFPCAFCLLHSTVCVNINQESHGSGMLIRLEGASLFLTVTPLLMAGAQGPAAVQSPSGQPLVSSVGVVCEGVCMCMGVCLHNTSSVDLTAARFMVDLAGWTTAIGRKQIWRRSEDEREK